MIHSTRGWQRVGSRWKPDGSQRKAIFLKAPQKDWCYSGSLPPLKSITNRLQNTQHVPNTNDITTRRDFPGKIESLIWCANYLQSAMKTFLPSRKRGHYGIQGIDTSCDGFHGLNKKNINGLEMPSDKWALHVCKLHKHIIICFSLHSCSQTLPFHP